MYPSVSLTSEKLSFSCIQWASNSPSHFYYFANLKFLSLQYYWLRYKCDDCQYSYFHYKQISGINTTSTNVSVSRGAQWTVMLRVYTRYGYGKYAQVTLVTTAVVNPVVDLKATLVGNTKVHLSWKAPLNTRDIQVRNIEPSSPHVRESGFQNPRNFRFWNPDPTNDWNPESKFH